MEGSLFRTNYNEGVSTLLVWLVFASTIMATCINLLLLLLLLRLRSSWHLFSFQLILVLTCIDLSSCFNSLMMCIVRAIIGYPQVFRVGWYCSLFGLGIVYFSCMSGVVVSMMALERYCLVCHRRPLSRRYTWAGLATVAVLLAIPMVLNALERGHTSDPTHTFCWAHGSKYSTIQGYFTTFMLALPLFVLAFCYISIFVTCLSRGIQRNDHYSRKASIRALIFMAFYLTIYIPNFILTIIERFYDLNKAHIALLVMGPAFLTLTTSTNPILALILHRKIKEEVISLLYKRNSLNKVPGAIRL
ncbi:hypothetical protein DSO57_1000640 [Entomophthora muscae]|uniref:Uncharacterized protein n=1 Tax=Entomophthora muscae TaxID=34485 RepID=A0ACC2S0F5_9FUNG|nr:hypothetical protein DSO57_1000640 [Entomophthora muscae]